jgi:hypothetical protein
MPSAPKPALAGNAAGQAADLTSFGGGHERSKNSVGVCVELM